MHVMKVHVLYQGDRSWPWSFNINDLALEIFYISGDSGEKTGALSPSLIILQAFR